jgi:signal transduction histidine kinase
MHRAWPVLLLFVAAALVPAGCVVWFMALAMSNETLAVRQRLRDVYVEKVTAASILLSEDLDRRLDLLERVSQPSVPDATGSLPARAPVLKPLPAQGQNLSPCERFAWLAKTSGADGIVICDREGRAVYPAAEIPGINDPTTGVQAWRDAIHFEQDTGDMAMAAEVYAKLASRTDDPAGKARALQAQVRCLMRLGRKAEALHVLGTLLADEHLRQTVDAAGRLIGPAAQLLELQLLADPHSSAFAQRAGRLRDRLLDYRGQPMPAAQRRFLLRTLEEISPSSRVPQTLTAEELTAEYLGSEQPPAEPGALTTTRIAGLWQVATPDRTVVALYRLDPLLRQWRDLLRARESAGMRLTLRPPQTKPAQPEPFLSAPAAEHLPGWTLEAQLEGQDPFRLAASRKALYLWTGGAGIAFIAAAAIAAAGFVGRQMRLTRLKNDLIATVSHELKTPLASMRVLVETLLEGRYRDDKQVREYLLLISKENVRLSRLIDNFLTFSRMERNKRTFDFRDLRVHDIVAAAVEATQGRFDGPGCRLEVNIEPDLPPIVGDRDALTTVLLNLLDNAYKYTRDDKHVRVRGYAEQRQVVLEVADNGIGIPRRAQRRIFDRFYQVDQSLARRTGGCGLGLSIVQFIVTAHGGTISVSSEPGKASRFTIRLRAGSGGQE